MIDIIRQKSDDIFIRDKIKTKSIISEIIRRNYLSEASQNRTC